MKTKYLSAIPMAGILFIALISFVAIHNTSTIKHEQVHEQICEQTGQSATIHYSRKLFNIYIANASTDCSGRHRKIDRVTKLHLLNEIVGYNVDTLAVTGYFAVIVLAGAIMLHALMTETRRY